MNLHLSKYIGNLLPKDVALKEYRKIKRLKRSSSYEVEIKAKKEKQDILEQKIIDEYEPCKEMKYILDSGSSLETDEFINLLENNYYNPDFMHTASCIVASFAMENSYAYELKIRKWINSLHRIGEESKYNHIMTANLLEHEHAFIVKAPKNEHEEDLLHEFVVGAYGLNRLREIVPNFAYILGGFKCSPLWMKQNFDAESWCNIEHETKVTYIVYENISPGEELAKYILHCSEDQFMSLWLQILYSLNIAQEEIRFNHNDLHPKNIIIRNLDSEVQIPYKYNGTKVYVKSDSIATFIDYGSSRFDLELEEKETITLTDQYVPYDFHTLTDIFKLLSFLIAFIWSKGKWDIPSIKIILELYRFFYDFEDVDDLLMYIEAIQPTYFVYIDTSENKDVKLYHYIEWIFSEEIFEEYRTNVIFERTAHEFKLLSCFDGGCMNKEDIVDVLALKKTKIVDIFDLLVASSKFEGDELSKFLENKEYRDILYEDMENALKIIPEIDKYFRDHSYDWSLIKELKKRDDSKIIDLINDSSFVDSYKNEMDLAMKMIDRFYLFKGYRDIGSQLVKYMEFRERQIIREVNRKGTKLSKSILDLMNKINDDVYEFKHKITSDEWNILQTTPK